jgi:hypothetical protein
VVKEVEEWIRRQRPKGVVVNTFFWQQQRVWWMATYSTQLKIWRKYQRVSAASDVVD